MAKPIRVGNNTKVALAAYAGTGNGGDAALLDGQSGTYYLDRANHTGTQLANTISNLNPTIDARVGVASTTFTTRVAFTGKIVPPAITATVNDYAPTGLSLANLLIISATGAQDCTGLEAQTDGRILFVQNQTLGGGDVTLKNNNAGSLAANRFLLNADVVIRPGQGVMLIYSILVGRWLLNQA